MQAYAFEAPSSLEGALTLLSDHGRDGVRTQILAGGTDLMVQMRMLDREPRTIIDVKRIPETTALSLGEDELVIGAARPAASITERDDVAALYPGLVEAIHLIGSTQIQGRASLGGNLCNASPAGDTIPALIANAGVCSIASASGRREMPVESFVTGVQRNALEPGELLVELRFPRPTPGSADAYLRFIPRSEMDIAVAGAGVRVTLNDSGVCTHARVAVGAVATTAVLVPAAGDALVGTRVDEAALKTCAEACSQAAKPITDKRGTDVYRRKVAGVLAKRAAGRAAARARGEPAHAGATP